MEPREILCFEPRDRVLLEDFLPPTHGPLKESSPDQREPFLTLTYAMSLDCKISLAQGVRTVLSGSQTKAMTHYLRSRHDAILVGVGTAEADDPSLNCRFSADGVAAVGLEKQPTPVILDPNARWTCRRDCKVLQLARSGKGKPVLWAVSKAKVASIDTTRRSNLDGSGFIVPLEPNSDYVVEWGSLLGCLSRRGVTSVMVEGGGKVIADLLQERNHRWVSSVIITIAPVWLGNGGVDVTPTRTDGAENREVGRLESVSWLTLSNSVDGVVAGRFGRQD